MEEIITEAYDLEDKESIIDEIMRNYGQDVLQLVFSYVRNQSAAEDLTQEIFVKCYNNLHNYNSKSKLKTWLWRIAINHSKDYLKSWYNNKVVVAETENHHPDIQGDTVEDSVIRKEEDNELAEAVMNLPIQYREVIYLYYFEEMQIKEIAKATDQKSNTVKTRLRRAKSLLKEQLGGDM
ncbi:sigma-70 family RNA polymerase sigma factor [Rossellomorea vietnamensis]|uniref:Sigma-70 family RNA polymerase sigma factor n=1 Tax=Rossellomorea vietnamensis TaxID=218284 RepID=A0A5D4MD38_9BACI|nr:sigma-70 family RNA polymerase sigma factor [Rossellomorea vietnamensis]TYR99754.1 sigma-70 family RNA polymerase sigma factor [Rossellomorea vietnamensis]